MAWEGNRVSFSFNPFHLTLYKTSIKVSRRFPSIKSSWHTSEFLNGKKDEEGKKTGTQWRRSLTGEKKFVRLIKKYLFLSIYPCILTQFIFGFHGCDFSAPSTFIVVLVVESTSASVSYQKQKMWASERRGKWKWWRWWRKQCKWWYSIIAIE